MRRVVTLDTNLLVLFVVGLTNPTYIDRHRRTRQLFVHRDFRLLEHLLLQAADLLLMPNVLSETSNLLRQGAHGAMQAEIDLAFRALVIAKPEIYVPSRRAAGNASFARLGLTDAALLSLERPDCVIVTTDHGLHATALHLGLLSVNFTHLQAEAG